MKSPKQWFTILLILIIPVISRAGILIDNVKVNDPAIEVNVLYNISWNLKIPGAATILVSDLQGNIVRTFMRNEEKKAGTHTVSWDGTGGSGDPCSSGIYVPIIRVKSKTKGMETYNPTSLTWGEEVFPETIEYDSENQVIRYTVDKRCFCRLRVGEQDGGPLYKTIADWKFRDPGTFEEPWDGLDTSGIVKAAEKTKLRISLDAFSVPENSLIIGKSQRKTIIKDIEKKYKKFPIHPPHGGQVAFYPSLPNGLLPDLTITTGFDNTIRKKRGAYQLHGEVPILVGLSEGGLNNNPAETLELMLFVNGQMVREDKIKGLPAPMNLDTTKFPNGSYELTINLRTSGDRAASSSMKISIVN